MENGREFHTFTDYEGGGVVLGLEKNLRISDLASGFYFKIQTRPGVKIREVINVSRYLITNIF